MQLYQEVGFELVFTLYCCEVGGAKVFGTNFKP